MQEDTSVWTNVYDSEEKITCLVQANDVFYACSNEHGVLRSEDDGSSWDEVVAGLESLPVSDLAVDPQSKKVYAATSHGLFSLEENQFVSVECEESLQHIAIGIEGSTSVLIATTTEGELLRLDLPH